MTTVREKVYLLVISDQLAGHLQVTFNGTAERGTLLRSVRGERLEVEHRVLERDLKYFISLCHWFVVQQNK